MDERFGTLEDYEFSRDCERDDQEGKTQLIATFVVKAWTHRYAWRNNKKRKEMYGKMCRIIIGAGKNSVLVEFEDGKCEIVSVRALRRVATRREESHGTGTDQDKV
jgi:hypothetical protein